MIDLFYCDLPSPTVGRNFSFSPETPLYAGFSYYPDKADLLKLTQRSANLTFYGVENPWNTFAERSPPEPGTISWLIDGYKTHKHSKFFKPENAGGLRFKTKENYRSLMDRLERDCGSTRVADIDAEVLTDWHETWSAGGEKVAISHSLIGMLRTVSRFGGTFLKSRECRDLRDILSDMRFKMPTPRTERLTADQVVTIRATARFSRWNPCPRVGAWEEPMWTIRGRTYEPANS